MNLISNWIGMLLLRIMGVLFIGQVSSGHIMLKFSIWHTYSEESIHWQQPTVYSTGVYAWSIYGIPYALSIAFYKYKLNSLRLSSSLTGLGIKILNLLISTFYRFNALITVGARWNYRILCTNALNGFVISSI